jgi:hypothetical protein
MTETKDTHPDFVTVTYGMRGFFAVHLSWNNEYDFYEPYQSGCGSYDTGDAANVEALAWARGAGIEYRPGLVGKTLAEVEEESRKAMEASRKRVARVKELRAEGMDFKSAYAQAKREEA